MAWNQIITEKCQILVRRTSSGNGWVIPSNHDHTTIITNRHNNKTRQSTFPFILEKVPIFRKIKSLSVVIKSYNGWFVIKWNHNLVIFLAEFYIGLLKTSCITLFRSSFTSRVFEQQHQQDTFRHIGHLLLHKRACSLEKVRATGQ